MDRIQAKMNDCVNVEVDTRRVEKLTEYWILDKLSTFRLAIINL